MLPSVFNFLDWTFVFQPLPCGIIRCLTYILSSHQSVSQLFSSSLMTRHASTKKSRLTGNDARQAAARSSDLPREARTRQSARLIKQPTPGPSTFVPIPTVARQLTPGPSHLPTPESTPTTNRRLDAAQSLSTGPRAVATNLFTGSEVGSDAYLLDDEVRKERWQWMKSVCFLKPLLILCGS